MNRLKKPLLPLLLASIMSCSLAPAMAAEKPDSPTQQIQIDHHVFTLPNGLTTVVHTDRSVPSVFVGVWYRVGSKDEPAGKTGFAHLFEHLMFQETKHRRSEYFLPLNKAGATDMNGITDADRTRYYQTVPSNALDLALWMESDRMAYLGESITQAVLDEQRAVVKNEKRQGEARADGTAMAFYRKHFFPEGHPYAHDTIGSMEDLDQASLDDVKQWFKDYYGASNAVLVLSGDIDLETAKQKVAHYFGDVPAGAPASRLEQWVPEFPGIKRDVIYIDAQATAIRRAWPVSNDDPRELTLLQLAAGSLAGPRNTFLHERLVNELELASSVTAGLARNRLSNTFSIHVTLRPGVEPEQAGQALDQALRDYFAKGPPDRRHIEAIALSSDNALLRSLESNAAVGMLLAEGQLYDDDPVYFTRQRQWAQDATPQDLQAVSRKWLDRPYYESLLLPRPRTAPAATTVDRSRIPEPGEFKGEVKFPPIAETTLSNGMKLVVVERHNLPLIDASVQFDTGSDADAAYAPGIASQAFKLMALGTQTYDAAALTEKMGRTGIAFNAAVSNRQSGFNWGMTSDRAEDGFALAAELLRRPRYPQAEIDKRVEGVDVDAFFDAQERQPINAVGGVFARALWGKDHPKGRITTREDGKRDTPRQHSHDLLARFHDAELGPNNATLYVLGDITLERARDLAERHFGNWRPVTPTPLEDSTRAPTQSARGRVILIDAPGTEQSSIQVGHLVGPFDPDTAAAESLADAILGASFHSRLNTNLRETKGWTYGFSAGVGGSPRGPRVFSAGGMVQADKTAQSLAEIRQEISDYVSAHPATEEELEREQASAIRAVPSSFTSGGAFLASMINSRSHGLPYNRAEGAMQRLASVSLDQVRERARATYQLDRLTWVIAGDLRRIEQDIRALDLGPVEVQDVYGNKIR
ncbi:Zinc protease [plant metagenome]|uniref:Zinc protease n=1 Tax=plant metagenome TaxID=1297885 RepID=A0A484P6V0_9ZZZZ